MAAKSITKQFLDLSERKEADNPFVIEIKTRRQLSKTILKKEDLKNDY